MVRFARIKGVHAKSSFNKVPEEATTWEELNKTSATDEDSKPESAEDVRQTKSVPKKVEAVWSEFEPETAECKKKKKRKKFSEFQSESKQLKKKKPKDLQSSSTNLIETADHHIEEVGNTGYIAKEVKSKKSDRNSIRDEERAKKLEKLKQQLREQGKDEKDIFGLNELEEFEPAEPKNKSWKTKFSKFEPETEKPKKKLSGKLESDNLQSAEDDQKPGNTAVVPPKKKSRKEKELEGMDFKRRKPDSAELVFCTDGREVKLEKFDGYLVTEERAKRLHELRHKLREEGKDEKDIFGIVRMERRKGEKELKSLKKRLCFHCRKGGHNISDCPELDKKPEQGTGICFKCGSTEHMLSQCKSKSNTLEYATCFICNEKGHLSKNCTNNPRGLYPDGGGCKVCGDVTHYERDCPKKQKRNREIVSAKRIVFDDVEALDYDDEIVSRKKAKVDVEGKRPNKIIKF